MSLQNLIEWRATIEHLEAKLAESVKCEKAHSATFLYPFLRYLSRSFLRGRRYKYQSIRGKNNDNQTAIIDKQTASKISPQASIYTIGIAHYT